MSNQDTAVAYDEGIKDRDREGGRSWPDGESALAWLKLTEVASALEAIQAEAQEAFESATTEKNRIRRTLAYYTCVQDLQDNISNLQLCTANEIKSLETK